MGLDPKKSDPEKYAPKNMGTEKPRINIRLKNLQKSCIL